MPYREVAYAATVTAAHRVLGAALKRTGVQNGEPRYNGPCPVCGGRDRFWVAQGEATVLIQCSHGCRFAELVAALGLTDQPVEPKNAAARRRPFTPTPTTPARTAKPAVANGWSARVSRVWAAASEPSGTPGARYLIDTRHVWTEDVQLPPAVRWLSRDAAETLKGELWPPLPEDATGALVYRFAEPGEAETAFVQLEAVDRLDQRRPFVWRNRVGQRRCVKRPSLYGSERGNGRVFFAVRGDGVRVHLTEGPLDALALATLARFQVQDLEGGAVHGVAGVATIGTPACHGARFVTLWPDGDTGAAVAARRVVELETALRRPVRIMRQPPGHDLADEAAEVLLERGAIRNEGGEGEEP